jgi:hypothetical protein
VLNICQYFISASALRRGFLNYPEAESRSKYPRFHQLQSIRGDGDPLSERGLGQQSCGGGVQRADRLLFPGPTQAGPSVPSGSSSGGFHGGGRHLWFHVPEGPAKGQFGIHIAGHWQGHLQQGRPVHAQERLERGGGGSTGCHPAGGNGVSLADGHKIRRAVALGRGLQIAIEVPLLNLAHHAVALVVEQKNLQRQMDAVHGLQFLDVHLEATITADHHGGGIGPGQSCADGGR